MAKRSTRSARRRTARGPQASLTLDQIVDLWEKAAKAGLGRGKKFDSKMAEDFRGRFKKSIQTHLDGPPPAKFDKAAEKATKTVARDLGAICRMLTPGTTVNRETFTNVLDFVQTSHPACPGTGSGAWCDVGG
jgi:hypothetical protein